MIEDCEEYLGSGIKLFHIFVYLFSCSAKVYSELGSGPALSRK